MPRRRTRQLEAPRPQFTGNMTGRLEEALSTTSSPPAGDTAPTPPPPGMKTGQSDLYPYGRTTRRERTTSGGGGDNSSCPSDPGGTTPTRRNKRKMTAPKRRSDFSIKRFCPDIGADMEDDDEEGEEGRNALEDYDDLGRERVPDRPSVSTTESSPDSCGGQPRYSPPSCPSPSGSDYSGPASTPEQAPRGRRRRGAGSESVPGGRGRAASSMSREEVGDSPGPSPGHPDPQHMAAQHIGPHHPAFNLSRHLAAGTSPIYPSLPLGPNGLLPTHPHLPHPHHLQGGGLTGGLVVMPQHPGAPTSPTGFHPPSPPSPADSTSSMADGLSSGGKKSRKNYKNMTRERRVEANARERSRVHTISAAFESLRRAVPSYSYNQKLSKLAILRIACSYILSLAKLADQDYSTEHREYTFADCVDMCTRVIQTEGRARRRH